MYDEFMSGFYQFTLCVLALVSFSYLARTMLGPTFFDRILGANNISTIVTVMICILAVEQGEQYLVDVALIYSMLGFVTVVIVCKAYLRSHNMELYSRFRNLPAPVKAERMATHLTTVATVVSHKKEESSLDSLESTTEDSNHGTVENSVKVAVPTAAEDASKIISEENLESEENQKGTVKSSEVDSEKNDKTSDKEHKVPSPVGNSQKKNYPSQKQGKGKKKGGKKS